MSHLYPLRFEPIYQYRLWGGRRLAGLLTAPPSDHRSADPILTPVLAQELPEAVPNVVFPTGIDWRSDLGSPDRFDVYYGMADNRIGVARLDLPDSLSAGGVADPPEGKV